MSASFEPAKGGGAGRRPSLVWPLIFGVAGVAVLLTLCIWQINRLEWKDGLIAELEQRIAAEPVPLEIATTREADAFRRVAVTGAFAGEVGRHGFTDAPFLTTRAPWGAGYRVIQPFDLEDGRRVLVDRGFVPVEQKNESGVASAPTPAPDGALTITGALRWPEDKQLFNEAAFGPNDNVWIRRDLALMAETFAAEPRLIVAETSSSPEGAEWPRPYPLTLDVKNDHLEYAITWGLLALGWAAMTFAYIRRSRRA